MEVIVGISCARLPGAGGHTRVRLPLPEIMDVAVWFTQGRRRPRRGQSHVRWPSSIASVAHERSTICDWIGWRVQKPMVWLYSKNPVARPGRYVTVTLRQREPSVDPMNEVTL